MEDNKLLAEAIAQKYFPDDAERRLMLTSDLIYFSDMCKDREEEEKRLRVCLN